MRVKIYWFPKKGLGYFQFSSLTPFFDIFCLVKVSISVTIFQVKLRQPFRGAILRNKSEPFRKPVHIRQTEIRTYDLGDHQILLEATLRDTRTPPAAGDSPEAAMVLVHDLVARIRVQGPDLTIAGVEAEMPQIPREGCREVLADMKKLVGLRIISGYTQKVKDLVGGAKGCSHLTHLFISLGPAAVQGYWAAYGRKPGARSLSNPALARVIDSCRVWRRDGPLVRSLTPEAGKASEGS